MLFPLLTRLARPIHDTDEEAEVEGAQSIKSITVELALEPDTPLSRGHSDRALSAAQTQPVACAAGTTFSTWC